MKVWINKCFCSYGGGMILVAANVDSPQVIDEDSYQE